MTDQPYYIEDLEVTVVQGPTNTPRAPRSDEREALDRYFESDEARDPSSGKLFRLFGQPVRGIEGAVLTYVRRAI